jgi:hypothetical protein
MEVTLIKDNEDGSADVRLENIEPKMMQLLIQTGFVKLMEDALDDANKNGGLPALFRPKVSTEDESGV